MSLRVRGLILTQLRRAEHSLKLNNGRHLHRHFIGFPLKSLISLITLTGSLKLFVSFLNWFNVRRATGRLEDEMLAANLHKYNLPNYSNQ